MREILKEPRSAKTIEAVIFDMDGTLIDSTYADFLAWQKLFLCYEKSFTYQEYMPLLGIKSFEVVKEYLPVKNDDEIRDTLAKKLVFFRDVINTQGIKPIPFAEDFLKELKQLNVTIALATSSRRAKMEMVMEKVGLGSYFEVIVTGSEVPNGKPAPDIFLRTAEKISVEPAHCLVFEDAVMGVAAAKKAGMRCVALSTPKTVPLLFEADMLIKTFEGLKFSKICSQLIKQR